MSANGIRRYCTLELQRMVDGTERLAALVIELTDAASAPLLKDGLVKQLEAVKRRQRSVEACLTWLGHPFSRADNPEVAALCDGARAELFKRDPVVRDMQIAHAAVRIQHYELGTCTALATWFRQLALDDVADRMEQVVVELQDAQRELASIRDSITELFQDDDRAIERGSRLQGGGGIVRP